MRALLLFNFILIFACEDHTGVPESQNSQSKNELSRSVSNSKTKLSSDHEVLQSHERNAGKADRIRATSVLCDSKADGLAKYDDKTGQMQYCRLGKWVLVPKGRSKVAQPSTAKRGDLQKRIKMPIFERKARSDSFYCRASRSFQNSFVCQKKPPISSHTRQIENKRRDRDRLTQQTEPRF